MINKSGVASDLLGQLYSGLKGRNLVSMGRHNRVTVLQCIRAAGEISTTDIAQAIGITIPCVFNIVKGLLREGVIEARKTKPLGSGKLVTAYALNVQSAYAVGLNIRPQRLEFVAIALNGRTVFRQEAQIQSLTVDAVASFADCAFKQCYDTYLIDRERVRGLGITFSTEMSQAPLPTGGLEALNHVLERTLGLKVHDGIDLVAAAKAEACFGAGLSVRSFHYLLISDDVTACFVSDQIVRWNPAARSASAKPARRLRANDTTGDPLRSLSLSALTQELAAMGGIGESDLVELSPKRKALIDRWA